LADAVALILAAGKGTRMKSDLPKVLHEVSGRPMAAYVVDAVRAAGCRRVLMVVGYRKDLVMETFEGTDVEWIDQDEQLGTGHAVMVAGKALRGYDGEVVVVAGDSVMLRPETIRRAIDEHRAAGAAATIIASRQEDPYGYGRIVRGPDGSVLKIVEERDAAEAERAVKDTNTSNYVFDCRKLFAALDRVRPENDQNEYYLTDVIAIMAADGDRVGMVTTADPDEGLGPNSRQGCAEATRKIQARHMARLMDEGVTIVRPELTSVDASAEIGPDTVIMPFTVIEGPAKIGAGCRIGPFAHVLRGAEIADGAEVPAFTEAGAAPKAKGAKR